MIGLCGTDNKCKVLTSKLGFDGAVNYKTENIEDRLTQLCPDGINGYFDNVGGDLSDKVIRQVHFPIPLHASHLKLTNIQATV